MEFPRAGARGFEALRSSIECVASNLALALEETQG